MNWQVYQLFYSYLYHLERGCKEGDDLIHYDTLRVQKHQAVFKYFKGDRIKSRDGLYTPNVLGRFIDDVVCETLHEAKGVLYLRLLTVLQKPKYKKWLLDNGYEIEE